MPAAAHPRATIGAGWQTSMREAIKTPGELLAFLELDRDRLPGLQTAESQFPLLVPRAFAARMRKGDPEDPLLRQVLPLDREEQTVPGFTRDPLEERRVTRGGVIEKYSGRALLVTTAACPVHCRYCFRRHFPYSDQIAAREDWRSAVESLEQDERITEVILSGGDPLSLSDRRLEALLGRLNAIPHLTTLRIHTRFPIVLPERVDAGLLETLMSTRLKTVVVVHCNHPQEVDGAVDEAFGALRSAGVTLLNQSVLLHGVNDDADTLVELSQRLFRAGALPYYLHELDRVAGAAHFEVETTRACELIEAIRARLPGYLVPRLVRERPSGLSKTVVA